ncbi:FAD/NAD(P)-binding domain-containing protein [Suillus subaureus]|uniref:FAD/NAD(P)-binding domain-containing protein n=1 Tax=Suillus subaureus TaxID=48587 RepID=A0A9P7J8A5_9AGAM|nr:FAD/NAD(P)-binding domain-containing protein [Suillus subaureus]KAG1807966.1 FAD/NAD(P)-binding domain-containing protein [Suillus subaureus]
MNAQESKTAGSTHQPDHLYKGRRASLPLNIVVIGCGMGGLAAAYCLAQAGHNITILEAASAIGEVGAGVQASPNVSRLLMRWGLGPYLEKFGVKIQALSFKRWSNDEVVGWTPLGDVIYKEYGSPFYFLHRADLHKMLYEVTEPCCNIRVNSRVVSMDPSKPSVTLASGEVVSADLIIGADGVKSITREYVVGGPDKPRVTGDAAYRAIIPAEKLLQDDELKPLVEKMESTIWMGPGGQIIGYTIRAKKEFNLVMVHPDEAEGGVESWTAEGNVVKMRENYKQWSTTVQKLLALVPSTLDWKLMDRDPLPSWIHKDGKLVLLGDSCHPMLPYRGQGLAMAIEDAAVLGNIFSHCSDRSDILPLLYAYQSIRYDRATATQKSSSLNRHILHKPDGPDQEARDRDMRVAMEEGLRIARGEPSTVMLAGNANQWADKTKSNIQFGYDADEESEKWWLANGNKLMTLVPSI